MQFSPTRFLLAWCALLGQAAAQTLIRSVPGPSTHARFGKACIVVDDQNGDGVKDVVVGAPGFDQERGAIHCVSGAFLATGAGAPTLWTCAPAANQGDLFGTAVVDVDDASGDGVRDFLVGQPGYDSSLTNDRGAIRLVSGASHAVLSVISGMGQGELMGTAIATTGDLDNDGRTEVLVGCPGATTSRVLLFRNMHLSSSGFALQLQSGEMSDTTGAELGASLAAGFEYVNSGPFAAARFVAGAPGFDAPGAANAGKVLMGVVTGGGGSFFPVREYVSSTPGERMGAAVHAAHDYDGDGVTDLVAGAPHSPNGTSFEVGRAVILSGARVFAQTPPYEIYALPYGSPAPPVNHSDPDPDFHFGAAVRACPDLNNDGVGEILVGGPDFYTIGFTGLSFRGVTRIFSGATGVQLSNIAGASTDRLGDGLGGAIADLDGDGFEEFVISGSRSDAGGVDSGVLKCYRLFPVASGTYCTGKVNSLGCTPLVSFSGTPSASSGLPFTITGSSFLNQKSGLLFYSHAPAAVLFQGGTKCVANPIARTAAMSSGGSANGADCTGSYGFDFNARIAGGVDPALVAGAEVYAQYWSRDPLSASHTSLSNAVSFVIHP